MKKLTLILISFVIISATLSAQNTIQKEILVYATKDGQKLFLDKYVDSRTQFTGKRPVMIYVHGGGFSTGSSKNASQIKYNKHFAAQGFVSISINYRLSIKADTPFDRGKLSQAATLATEDLIDATAFVISKAKEWNIDIDKIIISGGSAGAITCLNAEYAIISQAKFAEKLPEDFNYAGVISHAGNVIVQQDTLNWKKLPCPMLLMHGSADQLVTFNSSKIGNTLFAGSNYLHKQFEKMNAPHWLYEEVDADHIVALKPLQYNFWEIDSFLQRFVFNKSNAIIHTQWKDKKPDSMTEMAAVVPLYISGWEKTDEEVEQAQKKN